MTIAVLRVYGTPVSVSLLYLAYLVLAVALPGTVAWRMIRGSRFSFVEDVAIGSALGLAVQVVLAFALSPVRLSGLSWLWAPAVLLVSIAGRNRSAAWSRSAARPEGAVGAWVQAGVISASAVWLGATALARNPISRVDGSGAWTRAVPEAGYVDLPFHQAIAAGIQQHTPLVFPYLYDEPLHYHLFLYEHLASAAGATGIDLTWLVYRLHTLPLVALAIVLVGVLARRLLDRTWTAPLTTLVVTLSASASVYGWTTAPFLDPGFLSFSTLRSPTQTFGRPLFLATLTVTVIVLREHTPLRARLPLLGAFGLLALSTAGSKATFLPVLLGGLGLAVLAGIVRRSSILRPAVLTGLGAAAFLLVVVVMLGGQSGSLTVEPFALVDHFEVTRATADAALPSHRVTILILALTSWLCIAAGALLLGRERLADPAAWVLVGGAVAALAGSLITDAHGLSQVYFLLAGWPLFGILTVWGLGLAIEHSQRSGLLWVGAGLTLGAAATWGIALLSGPHAPPSTPDDLPLRALFLPWLALLAIAGSLAALAYFAGQRAQGNAPLGTRAAALAMVCVIAGAGLATRAWEVLDATAAVVAEGPGTPEGWAIPRDGAIAALHIRDSSKPGDVVATNAHCNGPSDACDYRHFWVSALSERRVVVEGWGYPASTRISGGPYWDDERLAANDAVFVDPSQEAVDLLVEEYGVRWLLVDRSKSVESEDLRRYARLVHESPGAAVYEIAG